MGWSASCRCRVVVIVSQDHRVLEAGLPMLRFASFWDPSELVRAVAAVVQVVVLGQVPSSHVWSGDLLAPHYPGSPHPTPSHVSPILWVLSLLRSESTLSVSAPCTCPIFLFLFIGWAKGNRPIPAPVPNTQVQGEAHWTARGNLVPALSFSVWARPSETRGYAGHGPVRVGRASGPSSSSSRSPFQKRGDAQTLQRGGVGIQASLRRKWTWSWPPKEVGELAGRRAGVFQTSGQGLSWVTASLTLSRGGKACCT